MKPRLNTAYLSVLALLLVVFTSCQTGPHSRSERYIFLATNINLSYWQEAQAGFLDSARALGVRAEFNGPAFYSPEEELKLFQEAVKQNPTGILISPARADIFRKPIDEAVQQGIPVICVDSDAPGSRRNLFVGTDNYSAGLESGRRMVGLLRGEGQVVIITLPGQHNLDERLRGVVDVFQKYPKIKIVRVLDDRGDDRIAFDLVSELITKKEKIDGIVCLEAEGGPGAATALQQNELTGKIPIVAMDKDPETLEWIARGGIAVTIAQKPYTMGFYGLKFLDDLHHNTVREFGDWRTAPTSPLPSYVDTGTAVLDSSNLKTFRQALASRRGE